MKLEQGKLPVELLTSLLKFTSKSAEILVGANTGEDAAIVKGEGEIVITSDPITFTTENIGTYTVAINSNDIVAMGGIPKYLTTTILLPLETDSKTVEKIFKELRDASEKNNILWVGGHTEVSDAVNRIVISGHVVGFLQGEETPTGGAKVGETIVMTKWAGLEGTTILAREKQNLVERLLGKEKTKHIAQWIENPGISIIKEGNILRDIKISAAHDPTEGGIATGLNEIAQRSNVGMEVYYESINIKEETKVVCNALKIDPLGLLSSGVFLFTASPKESERAITKLHSAGIEASIIGKIVERERGLTLKQKDRNLPIPLYTKDEIIRALQ